MTVHRFDASSWHNVLAALPPALTVASGDTVITETLDAHGFDKDGVERGREPNPMNGPIFVDGAEPGDALQGRDRAHDADPRDRLDPRRARRQCRRSRSSSATCRRATRPPGGSTVRR